VKTNNADGSVAGTPSGVRVFHVDDGFVVANRTGWIDGTYPTVDAAVAAGQEVISNG